MYRGDAHILQYEAHVQQEKDVNDTIDDIDKEGINATPLEEGDFKWCHERSKYKCDGCIPWNKPP